MIIHMEEKAFRELLEDTQQVSNNALNTVKQVSEEASEMVKHITREAEKTIQKLTNENKKLVQLIKERDNTISYQEKIIKKQSETLKKWRGETNGQ